MSIFFSIICIILFYPVIIAVFRDVDEKNTKYNEKRQTERMLRETMEQVRKNGHH